MSMSLSATRPPATSSHTKAHSNVGLMKGVNVESNDWYSEDVTPSPELTENGHFYQAAEKDASDRNCTTDDYLDELFSKITKMFRDGPAFDRETFKEMVKKKAAEEGCLTFISGSRNGGKTRLLKEIAETFKDPKNSNVMFVYVDGRDGSISQGIKRALNELKEKKWYQTIDFKKILSLLKSTKNASKPRSTPHPTVVAAGEAIVCDLETVFDFLTLVENEEGELVELVQKLAQEEQKIPCLVIDEANRVATVEDSALLAKIISLTKVRQSMSVLLCTSVHSYRHTMSEHFNLDHATASYVDEFPPSVMWDILTGNHLGMGEHLARLTLASCGGNLVRVKKMIELLRTHRQEFVFHAFVYPRMEGCDKIGELMGKGEEEKEIILSLAKKGYWASSHHLSYDKMQVLVESGVASYLERGDLVPGSPLYQVKGFEILVPTSLALRCYIIESYPDHFKSK